MELAPSAVTAIVMILSQVLPYFNINLGTAELTPMIQGLVAFIGGIYIYYRQIKTKRSTLAGTRPQ